MKPSFLLCTRVNEGYFQIDLLEVQKLDVEDTDIKLECSHTFDNFDLLKGPDE